MECLKLDEMLNKILSRMSRRMLDEIPCGMSSTMLGGMLDGFVLIFEITWRKIFGPIINWLGI